MTLREAMKILRVSEKTLLELCASGRFSAATKDGKWNIPRLPFDRPTMKPHELAAIVGVSREFILRLCREQRIRCTKIGKQWRIDFREAVRFVKSRNRKKGR